VIAIRQPAADLARGRGRVVIDIEVDATPPDVPAAVAAAGHILDAARDPLAISAALAPDRLLGPLVAANPGLRVTGSPDLFEAVVRAIVGQQVSVRGARTVLGRLVARFGDPVGDGWLLFPSPAALAGAETIDLAMPRTRSRALIDLAAAVAGGELDLRANEPALVAGLAARRGIGPWTVDYVRMRALRDPDVLLSSDIGVQRGLGRLGGPQAPREIERAGSAWAPWRSYAVAHLWAAAGAPAPGNPSTRCVPGTPPSS
jgi:AraC family transcriptional regulator of adaptative response / DNA-3-methyladenine glycosylase II